MKTASTNIFDLIKMMSASEKRYFQKHAQRHSNSKKNQYLHLYHAISSMQEYDETELKKLLKDSAIAAHFAVTKRYLYEQLLDSLHHYHLNQQLEEKILKDLHLCKILFEKNLVYQAEKRINKCSKLIVKHQLWIYSPLLVQLKRRLMRTKRQYQQELLIKSEKEYNDRLILLREENFYWLKTQEIIGLHLQKINLHQWLQCRIFYKNLNLMVIISILKLGRLIYRELPFNLDLNIDYLKNN